jgi:dsRNA-specific ribonuclease
MRLSLAKVIRALGKRIESREASIEAEQASKSSKDRSLQQLLQSEHQKAISYALAEGAGGRRTAAPLAPTDFKCDESPDPWFPA